MKPTHLLAGLLVAALAGGSALAHDDHPGGPHADGSRMAAMHARHHARLHDRLKLTAAQEPAWKTFSEKTKPDLARMKAHREEMAKLTTPERMDRMLSLMKEREGRMTERVAAVKEFYAQLTPEQQKIFDDNAMHRRGPHGRPAQGAKPEAAPAK